MNSSVAAISSPDRKRMRKNTTIIAMVIERRKILSHLREGKVQDGFFLLLHNDLIKIVDILISLCY